MLIGFDVAGPNCDDHSCYVFGETTEDGVIIISDYVFVDWED